MAASSQSSLRFKARLGCLSVASAAATLFIGVTLCVIAVCLFIWHDDYGLRLSVGAVALLIGLASLWVGWVVAQELEVELFNGPRRAIVRRENILTERSAIRHYPIPDDARVVVYCLGEGASNDYSVTLDGLPSYCDFLSLTKGSGRDDALRVGHKLASFLELDVHSIG